MVEGAADVANLLTSRLVQMPQIKQCTRREAVIITSFVQQLLLASVFFSLPCTSLFWMKAFLICEPAIRQRHTQRAPRISTLFVNTELSHSVCRVQRCRIHATLKSAPFDIYPTA